MNRMNLRLAFGARARRIRVAAQAQTIYRYVDPTGRVVYSDRAPPPAAKDVKAKRVQDNFIETDPVPFAAKEAADQFPVTLYTFDCDDVCEKRRRCSTKRGVPFTTVVVSDEEGAAKLRALTGKQQPLCCRSAKNGGHRLQLSRWHSVLDEAGYPKTAPSSRPAAARAPGSANAAPGPANAAAPATDSAPPPPPTRGTDYPK